MASKDLNELAYKINHVKGESRVSKSIVKYRFGDEDTDMFFVVGASIEELRDYASKEFDGWICNESLVKEGKLDRACMFLFKQEHLLEMTDVLNRIAKTPLCDLKIGMSDEVVIKALKGIDSTVGNVVFEWEGVYFIAHYNYLEEKAKPIYITMACQEPVFFKKEQINVDGFTCRLTDLKEIIILINNLCLKNL